MDRFRLSHILLCALFSIFLATVSFAVQNGQPSGTTLSGPYQKWLDEDVRYLINNEERAEFAKLETDQQRDKFIADFWERRNPHPGSEPNKIKEEHYRRLAYVNEHFAEGVPGYKTDRGRVYILFGPPDEREQHPSTFGSGDTSDTPHDVSHPSDVWRYHNLGGVGYDVFFQFIDKCRCGTYELQHDPSKKMILPLPRRNNTYL